MKIPLIDNLIDKIRYRGVQTGVNQLSSNVTMIGYVLVPLLAAMTVAGILLPPQMKDLTAIIILPIWIAAIFVLQANSSKKLNEKIAFPYTHIKFPEDEQQQIYDILINPKEPAAVELVCEYSDGRCCYNVITTSPLAYQNRNRPYPDIFQESLWITPANWEDSFRNTGVAEMFYDNLFATHTRCEFLELTHREWDERGSYRKPTFLVTGCSYLSKKTYETKTPQTVAATDEEIIEAYTTELKVLNRNVSSRNAFLEREAEHYANNVPRDTKDLSDKRISRVRTEVGDIMDTTESWKSRILNMKNIAYAIIIIGTLMLMSHFIFGWP